MTKRMRHKKQKEYTGMVELKYQSSYGIPTARYVMAFHSTKDELVETFLPGCKSTEVRVVKYKYERR